MIRQLGTKVVPLTRQLARDFVGMQASHVERPLRQKRLDFLRRELEAGNFHAPKWAVAHVGSPFPVAVRVNGQHSSMVLAEANGHFPEGLSVVIDEFACDNNGDVAELFTRFDAPESMRSTREQFGALARGTGLLMQGLSEKNHEFITSAVLVAKGDFKAVRKFTPHERAAVLNAERDFIAFAAPFATGRTTKPTKRLSVLAAVYLTWLRAPKDAQTFWSDVLSEADPDPNSPSRALARMLRKSTERTASADECARCIHAWNAFREGRKLLKLISKNGEIPAAR